MGQRYFLLYEILCVVILPSSKNNEHMLGHDPPLQSVCSFLKRSVERVKNSRTYGVGGLFVGELFLKYFVIN